MNKKKEIQKIYDNFSTEFKSKEFSSVRKALSNISKNNKNDPKYLHNLGKFVIFYSLPSVNPEIMIIGDNPSWFHKKNPFLAKKNLEDVAGKIPKINSYKIHDHTFGNQIRNVFNLIGKESWLDKAVGLNRFWIQTGGGGTKEFLACTHGVGVRSSKLPVSRATYPVHEWELKFSWWDSPPS